MSIESEVLAVNSHFLSPDIIVQHAREFALANGFVVACNSHPFSVLNPHPIQGAGSKIWQRAKIYCNYRDQGSPKEKRLKSTCSWYVNLTFDRKAGDYVINHRCMDHNHIINNALITPVGGLHQINLLSNLKMEEREMIHLLSRYNLPLSKIREMLEGSNPGRTYSTSLLSRQVRSGKELHFGNDPHCMTRFMEAGYAVRENGGLFCYSMDMSQRLSTISLQTAQMSLYAKAYADFTIVDGTHNTTTYDLKLMPFTNVDCLGKNVVSGVLLDESENSLTISEALAQFHLEKPYATLMTDGGSAYPAVAHNAQMTHILCSYHFQKDVFASCGGMGPVADCFKQDTMALIYTAFELADFEKHVNMCLNKFAVHSAAVECINKIVKFKEKVCRTFTGRIFTCNHVATQRGESVNSSIKEKGVKKKELRGFNLLQLWEHLLNQFNRMEASSLDVLCDLIRNSRKWSKYVEHMWQDSYQEAAKLPFVGLMPDTNDLWYASSSPDQSLCHVIDLSLDGPAQIPTCSCQDFSSSLIPCAGICAALCRLPGRQLFHVSNLHPRWRISSHPLFDKALAKLNLRSVATLESPDLHQTGIPCSAQHHLNMTAYQSIMVPTKRDLRYTKLNNLFKTIEPIAISNDHYYKLLTLNLLAFKQSLHGEGSSEFILPEPEADNTDKPLQVPVLPPRKRGGGDDVNRSLLSSRKRLCSACIKAGLMPTDNHRARSSKCPSLNAQIPTVEYFFFIIHLLSTHTLVASETASRFKVNNL
uniref:ZSWIM1/3 RNaseH-like domain-containing protein n=1 Tax=Spongospora subterranea TaxID=70186 RepID=A0A0H5R2R8_9EUKA|eukprot:CRZ08197.1 hypothetical protein [Spongospora subterranea]